MARNVFHLIQSKEASSQRAAVLAIGKSTLFHSHDKDRRSSSGVVLEIIKGAPLDNRANFFRFFNHLTSVLWNARDHDILLAASQLIGRLIEVCDNVLGDRFVEDQISNFLEMGSTSDGPSTLAVVLVLKEFAKYSPTSFFPLLSAAFRSIIGFLKNPQVRLFWIL